MTTSPQPCVVALQRILCDPVCYAPRTEDGPIPGGDCWPHGDGYGIFTPCDDGFGNCPAPDCIWHGSCICACHTTFERNTMNEDPERDFPERTTKEVTIVLRATFHGDYLEADEVVGSLEGWIDSGLDDRHDLRGWKIMASGVEQIHGDPHGYDKD